MCGRKYASEELTWAEYREMLVITAVPTSNLQPNYNIAPTHIMPVCVERFGERKIVPLQWGLVPFWAKEAKIGSSMINARSETLEEKPSFRNLLKSNRCIIMVSGFYEWQRSGKEKQAHKVEHSNGSPMMLAGLSGENEELGIHSYTVITTAATEAFATIHNRLPAIVSPGQVDCWMDAPWSKAKGLLAPYAGDIEATPVSNNVGNVRNNYPELLNAIG